MVCAETAPEINWHAQHMVVVDEASGAVLLSKSEQQSVPMASLTKLMTAMVVLDAGQDLDEPLSIDVADLDMLKHTRGGVPVGASLSRAKMLELALLASDNHAASSLARHYPGGMSAFLEAVQVKGAALGLSNTRVVEPTGLSPENRSSANDLVSVVRAASEYPAIATATTQVRGQAIVKGRTYLATNTNRLVGRPGWDILLSKTGFTNEAGRCLVMRLRTAGKTVLLVLLNASAGVGRTLDATNIARWLSGQAPVQALARATVARGKHVVRAGQRGQRVDRLA